MQERDVLQERKEAISNYSNQLLSNWIYFYLSESIYIYLNLFLSIWIYFYLSESNSIHLSKETNTLDTPLKLAFIFPCYQLSNTLYRLFAHPFHTHEAPLLHLTIILGTHKESSWINLVTQLKPAINFPPQTPLEDPQNSLETPLKHPWNTHGTPLKHPQNTVRIIFDYVWQYLTISDYIWIYLIVYCNLKTFWWINQSGEI